MSKELLSDGEINVGDAVDVAVGDGAEASHSDIEPDRHDVAISHEVVLPFEP